MSRAYLNRTFESRFPIALSIALRAKLTLRACERAQVPFNVWAYLSVRFKPQEKYSLKAYSLARLETLQPRNLLRLRAQLPKSLNLLSRDYLSTLDRAKPRVTRYVISRDLDENLEGKST